MGEYFIRTEYGYEFGPYTFEMAEIITCTHNLTNTINWVIVDRRKEVVYSWD